MITALQSGLCGDNTFATVRLLQNTHQLKLTIQKSVPNKQQYNEKLY